MRLAISVVVAAFLSSAWALPPPLLPARNPQAVNGYSKNGQSVAAADVPQQPQMPQTSPRQPEAEAIIRQEMENYNSRPFQYRIRYQIELLNKFREDPDFSEAAAICIQVSPVAPRSGYFSLFLESHCWVQQSLQWLIVIYLGTAYALQWQRGLVDPEYAHDCL